MSHSDATDPEGAPSDGTQSDESHPERSQPDRIQKSMTDGDVTRWGRLAVTAMHQAMHLIRASRRTYVRHSKPGHAPGETDDVTSADLGAQKLYVDAFLGAFPTIQILAEEEDPRLGPVDEALPYITIDPLDGTGAFLRRQSSGVGSMVALVHRGEVLGAYVGDALTREVIGYAGPGPVRQYLGAEDVDGEVLEPPSPSPPERGYLSLRQAPEAYSAAARALIRKHRGVLVYSGSVGVAAMELWRGAVAGLLLPLALQTPWDGAPPLGISSRLGIERWAVSEDGAAPDSSGITARVRERTTELFLAPAGHMERLSEP